MDKLFRNGSYAKSGVCRGVSVQAAGPVSLSACLPASRLLSVVQCVHRAAMPNQRWRWGVVSVNDCESGYGD